MVARKGTKMVASHSWNLIWVVFWLRGGFLGESR
jgi:hypothetical protein